MNQKRFYPWVTIDRQMIQAAQKLVADVQVQRTIASPFDTLSGILGELAFAEYYFGDWRKHRVGKNKGESDFPDIEIKTSAFPLGDKLHLLVREDYARKRKPPFYIQIIIDLPSTEIEEIPAGSRACLCGFATARQIEAAPLKDFGSKYGGKGGYRCHYIAINQLTPMENFGEAYRKYQEEAKKFSAIEKFENFQVRGHIQLLSQNPLGVFCSRRIPSEDQELITDFLKSLIRFPFTLAGTWQSPLEKKLFEFYSLRSPAQIIWYLSRGISSIPLSPDLKYALNTGKILLIAPNIEAGTPYKNPVIAHDQLILKHLPRLLFLSINQGGNLERIFHKSLQSRKQVYLLDSAHNKFWQRYPIQTISKTDITQLLS
ncbi:MAG: hypothetical protein Kow0042_28830 [Calditrichia bacterium]